MRDPIVDLAMDDLLASWQADRTLTSIADRLAEDVIAEDWLLPGRRLNKDDLMEHFYAPMARSVPDLRFDVFDTLRDGNRIVVRAFFNGTFANDYEDVYAESLPASGLKVRWEARDMYQFREDKIDYIWFANDTMTVLRELGGLTDDVRLHQPQPGRR